MTAVSTGALGYLDAQLETIRTQVPAALAAFDATAVHQSRVATRRLKAGFDVLEPVLAGLDAGGLGKAGKVVRRRLGPLRDLDVMTDALAAAGLPPRLAEAADWLGQQFEMLRTDARADSALGPKKSARLLARFDDWWRVRHAIEAQLDAVGPLLAAALHARFDRFAGLADRVAGVADSPADAPPPDVHELRIDGKAVRYAFELAVAHGLPVPKRVAKTFKAMQDALGDWHDAVVLADRILAVLIAAELTLHRPTLASAVLDVARVYLQRSERALAKFKAQWTQAGASLRQTLVERVPLTVDVAPAVTTEALGDSAEPSTDAIEESSDAVDAPDEVRTH